MDVSTISYAYFEEDLELPAPQLDVFAGEFRPLFDLVIPFVPLHLRLRFRSYLNGGRDREMSKKFFQT